MIRRAGLLSAILGWALSLSVGLSVCLSVGLGLGLGVSTTSADETDLSGGVFIAHAPAGFTYSPELDWCDEWSTYGIASCEEQVTNMPLTASPEEPTLFYVVCAWTEEKVFCATEFGFAAGTGSNFYFTEYGSCHPNYLELSTDGWPGPGEGTAVVATDIQFTGNFVPAYYFLGYAYYSDQLQLDIDPAQEIGGTGNCLIPPEIWDAVCFGAMGIGDEPGAECCPPPPPPEAVCCVLEECSILTQAECLLLDGLWFENLDLCDPNPCSHETFLVRPDGTGDFPTIQTAIYAAENGDTILLGSGTFTGVGNRDLNCQGKSIHIVSEADHPDSCFIDCGGTPQDPHRAFHFRLAETAACVVEAITILNGHAGAGPDGLGGAILADQATPTLRRCILRDCVAYDGGAIACVQGSPAIERCTIVNNRSIAPGGAGGIYCGAAASPTLEQTIIAFSPAGQALRCEAGATPQLSCCDLWANAGGDWTGCISGQYGQDGNISGDPIFCNPGEANFHLACDSPCLDTPCGVIGCLEDGCSFYAITAISDVGGDQGGQVRLRWHRACDDRFFADPPVEFYSIWRRIDDRHTRHTRDEGPMRTARLRDYPPGEWDYVTLVPAAGETTYSTLVPTLCDSTAQGLCWSVFFLRAHTDIPTLYYDTVPDSGYSVDNLAPSPPENLRLEQASTLVWDPPTVQDFDYATVYGSHADVLDSTAVVLGHTSGATFSLSPPYWSFYHVTLTDFAGNEGAPSSITGFAGVDIGEPAPPVGLLPARPNPAAPGDAVLLTFRIPTPQHVRLEIFDVTGRRVKLLHDEPAEAGVHEVTWSPRDHAGRPLTSGIYLCRMTAGTTAGAFTETRKVAIRR